MAQFHIAAVSVRIISDPGCQDEICHYLFEFILSEYIRCESRRGFYRKTLCEYRLAQLACMGQLEDEDRFRIDLIKMNDEFGQAGLIPWHDEQLIQSPTMLIDNGDHFQTYNPSFAFE